MAIGEFESHEFRLINSTSRYIKTCCIASVEEAEIAIAAGASAIGLVSEMPSGPGVIDEATVARIIEHVDRRVETFLLTALVSADRIAAQHARCAASAIQLVNDISAAELLNVRAALPSVKLVKVIHVIDETSIAEATRFEPYVDAILLDTGRKAGSTPQLGGTGQTHDWRISQSIVTQLEIPVLLAGGLCAENVQDALGTVPAFGVDVCSGVRTQARLDREKLVAFIQNARAFQ